MGADLSERRGQRDHLNRCIGKSKLANARDTLGHFICFCRVVKKRCKRHALLRITPKQRMILYIVNRVIPVDLNPASAVNYPDRDTTQRMRQYNHSLIRRRQIVMIIFCQRNDFLPCQRRRNHHTILAGGCKNNFYSTGHNAIQKAILTQYLSAFHCSSLPTISIRVSLLQALFAAAIHTHFRPSNQFHHTTIWAI